RHDALRMAIVIAAAGAVVGYGVVGLAQGAAAIAVAFVFASMFYTPIMPLADAYALRGLARVGRAYGPVRMWGSAAFIAGSFGAGVLLDVAPARDLIWLIVAAAVITAAGACALEPLAPHSGRARPNAAPPTCGRRADSRIVLRRRHLARPGLSRDGGGRQPHPGEPRGL